jgi:hypothetical protein
LAASRVKRPTLSGYTEAEWNYVVLNPETGKKEGNVPAKYNPAKGHS